MAYLLEEHRPVLSEIKSVKNGNKNINIKPS